MTHRILPLIACLLLLAPWSHADDSSLTIKDVIDTGEKAEAVIADSLQDDSIRPGDTPLSTMLAIMNAARTETGTPPGLTWTCATCPQTWPTRTPPL